jgi:hypothetical protein
VIGVLLANIFDSKDVKKQGKGDPVGMMSPQSGGAFIGGIAVLGKLRLKVLVGNEASLLQAGISI